MIELKEKGSRNPRGQGDADHVSPLLLLFIPNFYTATSKHKVLRCGSSRSSTESSQRLSQQVNKCSEVKIWSFQGRS